MLLLFLPYKAVDVMYQGMRPINDGSASGRHNRPGGWGSRSSEDTLRKQRDITGLEGGAAEALKTPSGSKETLQAWRVGQQNL